MTRAEAWFSHGATALVGVSGLIYGWMLYLAVPEDEFALVNHPWQPELQGAHIVLAPLVVFATGLFWREHVWRRVRSGFPIRRATGLSLFGLFAPMSASGYLLQVTGDERWQRVWVIVHVATSCAWILVYLVHQLRPRRRLSRARRGAEEATQVPS